MPLGEFRVAGVEAVDLRLEGLVLLLGGHGARLRLVAGGGEAFDLGLGRGGAGTGGAHLSLEPGEPFAPVGDGAGDVLQPPLLLGEFALQFGAVGDGVLQRAFGRLQGGLQLGLLLADAGGLALHVLGVPAAPLLGGAEVALFTRASASETVPRTRSASWESSYQVCWALCSRGVRRRTSSSRRASRWRAFFNSASAASLRCLRAASSAISA